MTYFRTPRGLRAMTSRPAVALLSAAAMAASSIAATSAMAQTPAQSTSQPPAAAAPAPDAPPARGLFPAQPPPAEKPGFIYAFGHWWDSARGKLDELRKQSNEAATGAANATQDAVRSAAQATRGAATAIVRLPGARFIEVHERCGIAPNGAPDCRTAAATACRVKGFGGGHPVDVQSSENCPPAVWMSGREPAPGECPAETVVLLAACD